MLPPPRIVRRHAVPRDAGRDAARALLALAIAAAVGIWGVEAWSWVAHTARFDRTVWALPAALVAGAGIAALRRWDTRLWAVALRVGLGVAAGVLMGLWLLK